MFREFTVMLKEGRNYLHEESCT